jgi:hypothetical protein
VSVGGDDHLVDGSGWLIFPDLPKAAERKWIANSDNLIGGATTAGFVAWREKDRIVFVKPLTFSHWLGWSAKPEGARTHFALRAGLYFRPSETKLFETKLCHEALALRIETVGDINGDGEVDWVDVGIAYRERYIKSHKRDCLRHRLRDAFRVYHSVHAYPSYETAFAGLTDIDFADGIWVSTTDTITSRWMLATGLMSSSSATRTINRIAISLVQGATAPSSTKTMSAQWQREQYFGIMSKFCRPAG